MKIVHFSDLHFSHFVKNPLQFFSKTWIGNANLLLKRGKQLQPITAETLVDQLKPLHPDLCLITGDFTTTSQPYEFKKAVEFVQSLKRAGLKVLKIPGNHDHYTKKAHDKKIFYDYLTNDAIEGVTKKGSLKQDGYEIYLFPTCTLVLLDLTIATPWFTAYGSFSPHLEEVLKNVLSDPNLVKPFVFAGHFPILDKEDQFHNALKHSNHLLNVISHHAPAYYLHGHNHLATIIERHGCIQVDSGSLSDTKNSSFSLLDTQKNRVQIYLRSENGLEKGGSYGPKVV